jgi:hypothetical protein
MPCLTDRIGIDHTCRPSPSEADLPKDPRLERKINTSRVEKPIPQLKLFKTKRFRVVPRKEGPPPRLFRPIFAQLEGSFYVESDKEEQHFINKYILVRPSLSLALALYVPLLGFEVH